MSISISAKARIRTLALGAMSLAIAAPAAAQKVDSEDVKDVAETPLEDLGLSKEEIAEILLVAAENPYNSEGLTTCNAIVGEIAQLDTVLGDDYDIAGEKKGGINAKKAAKSVVGSIVPFRGIVREISGAAGDRRKAEAAVRAGMVRRGYLKGLGQSRGCDYPARPKPQE
jgi:hypothetical protein